MPPDIVWYNRFCSRRATRWEYCSTVSSTNKAIWRIAVPTLVEFQAESEEIEHLLAVTLVVPITKDQRRARFGMCSGFADDLQIGLSF